MNQELLLMFNGSTAERLNSESSHEVTTDGVIAAFYNEMQRSIQAETEADSRELEIAQAATAPSFVCFKDVDCPALSAETIVDPIDNTNSVVSEANLKFIDGQYTTLPEDNSLKVKTVEIPDSWRIAVLEPNGNISHNAEPLIESEKQTYQLWECPICTALFREKEICEQHVKRSHDFSCGLCNEPFQEKEGLENHVIRHISEIPGHALQKINDVALKKKADNEFSENFSSLKRQETDNAIVDGSVKEKSVDQAFRCGNCNLSFSSTEDLVRHEESHFENDSSSQFMDSEESYKPSGVKSVVESESSWKSNFQYVCEVCNKVCFTKNSLLLHMKKRHASVISRNYICIDCGKGFKWKLSLENHQVIQHGKRKRTFACQICSKICPNNKLLEEHALSHQVDTKCLICDFCGTKFKQSINLLNHIKIRHPNGKNVSCTDCGKSFKSKIYLDAHISEVHFSRKYEDQ